MKLYCDKAQADRIVALSDRALARWPLAAGIALAWALRQREPQQSLRALERAEPLLATVTGARGDRLRGRAALVRAELAWLHGRADEAARRLDDAESLFAAAADARGAGDAHLLRSRLAYDEGDSLRREEALSEARSAYRLADDVRRVSYVDAWEAVDASFHGAPWLADALLAREAELHDGADDPALGGLWRFVQAQLAFSLGDYAQAGTQFESASQRLHDGGLIRQSIAAMLNGGAAAGNLNDFESQTVAVERALAVADRYGWPHSSAACCYSLGDVYQALGRLDDAKAAFERASRHIAPAPRSRLYVVVHSYLGEVCGRTGDTAGAHQALTAALQAAEAGGHATLVPRIRVALAASESASGHPQEALRIAHHVLATSEGNDLVTERLALLALARIHLEHPLLPDAESGTRSPALHHLDRLWKRLAESRDWEPDDEILSAFAQAHEQAGDFEGALHYERWRIRALGAANTQRANRQTSAMHARHEARLAKLELEHQQAMHAMEANRLRMVERLAMAGRDITESLELPDVFASLAAHAAAMLPADALGLWLMEGDKLVPARLLDHGKPVAGRVIALADPASSCARAAREHAEVLIERGEGEVSVRHIPGTRHSRTALFAPLASAGRVLGVLGVQSDSVHAYGELEHHIFRNLVSYCAVAINNALNFRTVQAANRQMAQAQAELEVAAQQDALTGVSNRRHLMQWSGAALGRRDADQSVSVLLLDIDHFKSINDRYGHAAGDEALRVVAQVLRQCVRPGDAVGRYGGEEFAIVLPGSDTGIAVAIAERVRAHIAAASIEHDGRRFTLTASVGVAPVLPGEATVEGAVDRADQALYRAKSAGRDRVCLHRAGEPRSASLP